MSTENGPDSEQKNAAAPRAWAVSGRGLLKTTSVVSGMTLLSRILGLVRDMVLARYFATSIVMDAFLVANRIPNMLRRFFAEGAFSQGFVPVMASYRERNSHAEAREFVDATAGTFAAILFVVTLVGVIAAPVLVAVVAPGFITGGGDFDLATMMLRFTFPYLFFVSLTAFAGGILNTYGRFAATAFSPVLLNVALIAAVYWWAPRLAEPGMALAYAVFAAGIMQLLLQLPFLIRIGALPRPKWQPSHEGVRRAMRLMLPAIFGSSVAQINVLIGGIIASMLGVGKISLLYYSDRLMEFPLGLFGIALATVTLPYLARQFANDAHDEFSATIDWSMKLVLLISVPAAIGLTMLAEPLVATIFYGGNFSYDDVRMTALALQAFSVGLIGFSFVKILAPAFFARHDTRTPVRVGLIALAVNFVLSVVLVWFMTNRDFEGNHAGLALATSVAAMLNAWLLYRGLRKDNIVHHSKGWGKLALQALAANLVMICALYQLNRPLDWWTGTATSLDRAGWLGVTIVAAACIYLLVLYALGLRTANLGMRPR